MKKILAYIVVSIVAFCSCSKKYVPQNSDVTVVTLNSHKNNTAAKATNVSSTNTATRSAVKRSAPATAPKIIWVNDKAAKKNFDGRLYYDLEGKRYWKNYEDGKYYLYNKAMYNNAAFKPR